MSGLVALNIVEECKMYNFPTRQKEIKHRESTKTDALHTEEEISAVANYFKSCIEECTTFKKETMARRNLAMFICGINIGLRGGDLCKLTWSTFFDDDWEWRLTKDFIPEKTRHIGGTGKRVELSWNEDLKFALEDWLRWLRISNNVSLNDYIFISPHGHISLDRFENIMNKATRAVGIKRRIGVHGLRKTMGNRYYKMSEDKTEALVDLKDYFNHADLHTTMIYICLEKERMQKTKDKMSFLYDKDGNWNV